ncbi:hypothetical protein HanRHA438_Chr04g0199801 [Helianthus annuus]|nr:hypothetical protein HanIR_Chr12g0599591 [Helianthus annuus]KAJ0928968.1 hypothetical protein HanRHA438_Chr04g0199801 [Helianthus annuus]
MALEDLEPQLPRFTGSDPNSWISQSELYFRFYSIYGDERFSYVIEVFEDEPFYWFNSWFRSDDLTWNDFTTAMVHQFCLLTNTGSALKVFDEMPDSINNAIANANHKTTDDEVFDIPTTGSTLKLDPYYVHVHPKRASIPSLCAPDCKISSSTIVDFGFHSFFEAEMHNTDLGDTQWFAWKPGLLGHLVPVSPRKIIFPNASTLNFQFNSSVIISGPNSPSGVELKHGTIGHLAHFLAGYGSNFGVDWLEQNFAFDPGTNLAHTASSNHITSMFNHIAMTLLEYHTLFLDPGPIFIAMPLLNFALRDLKLLVLDDVSDPPDPYTTLTSIQLRLSMDVRMFKPLRKFWKSYIVNVAIFLLQHANNWLLDTNALVIPSFEWKPGWQCGSVAKVREALWFTVHYCLDYHCATVQGTDLGVFIGPSSHFSATVQGTGFGFVTSQVAIHNDVVVLAPIIGDKYLGWRGGTPPSLSVLVDRVMQQHVDSLLSSPWSIGFETFLRILQTHVQVITIYEPVIDVDSRLYLDSRDEVNSFITIDPTKATSSHLSTIWTPIFQVLTSHVHSMTGQVQISLVFTFTVEFPWKPPWLSLCSAFGPLVHRQMLRPLIVNEQLPSKLFDLDIDPVPPDPYTNLTQVSIHAEFRNTDLVVMVAGPYKLQHVKHNLGPSGSGLVVDAGHTIVDMQPQVYQGLRVVNSSGVASGNNQQENNILRAGMDSTQSSIGTVGTFVKGSLVKKLLDGSVFQKTEIGLVYHLISIMGYEYGSLIRLSPVGLVHGNVQAHPVALQFQVGNKCVIWKGGTTPKLVVTAHLIGIELADARNGIIQSNLIRSKTIGTTIMCFFAVWIDSVHLFSEDYTTTNIVPTLEFGYADQEAYKKDSQYSFSKLATHNQLIGRWSGSAGCCVGMVSIVISWDSTTVLVVLLYQMAPVLTCYIQPIDSAQLSNVDPFPSYNMMRYVMANYSGFNATSFVAAILDATKSRIVEITSNTCASTLEFVMKSSSLHATLCEKWCVGMQFKMPCDTNDPSHLLGILGTCFHNHGLDFTQLVRELTSFDALYGHKPPETKLIAPPNDKPQQPKQHPNVHLEDKVNLKGGSNVMNHISPLWAQLSNPFKEPNKMQVCWIVK